MNRREALAKLGALGLGALAGPAWAHHHDGGAPELQAPRRRCRPVISGPLWWLDPQQSAQWGREGWQRELAEQQAIGFDLLWLANTPQALDHPGDPLGQVLDLCAERRMQVMLDTGSTGRWYSPLDLGRELAVCGENVRRLGERYRGHPAFWGWYIPHEIYMAWDEWARYIDALYPALAERCRRAAPRPVTVSPFFILDRTGVFGDFRYNEPDEYRRYWARLVRRAGLEVVMLQDSGEHFSYVTNAERRPFFAAMQAACREGGAKLWGNVETAEFECPSLQEYERRYGRVHHSTVRDAPWRPVPIGRLAQKLELAAQFCERIVTWGYREFCRPALGPRAQRWYEDYRRYVRRM